MRQINANGLALIKQYEGLRLKAYKCPAGISHVPPALLDFVNLRIGNVKPFSYFRNGKAAFDKNSDSVGLEIGNFCSGGKFTPQIDKANIPLSFGIFRTGNPLKIVSAIVNFVPIDVVNYGFIKMAFDKCMSNKAVNAILGPLTTMQDGNLTIPVPRDVRPQYLAGPTLAKAPLDGPISSPSIGSCDPVKRPHAAKIADFGTNATKVNGLPYLCGFHSGMYNGRAHERQAA